MNKIKVIKKGARPESGQACEASTVISEPNCREVAAVVSDWISDWRLGRQIETRQALDRCARLRLGRTPEM